MDFMELARKRRSIREYLQKPVPREIIDYCIEAARIAPSAVNSQPYSFIVVDDEKTKKVLADKAFSGRYSPNAFAKDAPVIIAVISEKANFLSAVIEYLRDVRYYLIDIGIACEHLVLAAAEKGVGTCWLGWFDEKGVKEALGIPKNRKVDILISMGYPQDDNIKEKGRKKLDEIRKFNNYRA